MIFTLFLKSIQYKKALLIKYRLFDFKKSLNIYCMFEKRIFKT